MSVEMPMQDKTDRLPGLDGLRGIAAVAVMLFHFDFVLFPSSRLGEFHILDRGYLSVDLFFMMSGFIMAHIYGEQMSANPQSVLKSFVQARIGRIYPLFILTLLIVVAIYSTGFLSSDYVSFSAGALALQPFMLQAWHHGSNWNFPSWSIGTEAAAYVAFIFTARPLLFGRRPILIAISLISLIIVMCFIKGGRLEFASQIPAYVRTFAGFGLGVLVFRAMRSHRDTTCELAIGAIGPLLIAGYFTNFDMFYYCALAQIMVLAVSGSIPLLDRTPFRKLGDWSYGIYLWHIPVGFAIIAVAASRGYHLSSLEKWEARGWMAVVGLFVIALSALAYHFFEVPARKSIRSTFQKPLPEPLPAPVL